MDVDLLKRMTSEDGMTRVRKAYLAEDSELDGRCCTALAESEIRLWWRPRYVRA